MKTYIKNLYNRYFKSAKKIVEIEINEALLNKAIIFATAKHAGITRKGNGMPYIFHPVSVANRIFTYVGGEDVMLKAIVAILHDVVEDCYQDNIEEGLALITKYFGPKIAGLVGELTLDKKKYESIGKTQYLIQELNTMSETALEIKLCDRWDNVYDMATMDADFQKYYVKQTHSMLASLTRELTSKHNELISYIKAECSKYN